MVESLHFSVSIAHLADTLPGQVITEGTVKQTQFNQISAQAVNNGFWLESLSFQRHDSATRRSIVSESDWRGVGENKVEWSKFSQKSGRKFLPAGHEACAVGMIGGRGRTDGVGISGGCPPKRKRRKKVTGIGNDLQLPLGAVIDTLKHRAPLNRVVLRVS